MTGFEYLAQPISSLRRAICLCLNKQDTLTGRSELGMQQCQLLLQLSSPLQHSHHSLTWLCILSQGEILTPLSLSLYHFPCLVPPFTLSDVLLSPIFISLMKKSSDDCGTRVGGQHSKVCARVGWGYVVRFKD